MEGDCRFQVVHVRMYREHVRLFNTKRRPPALVHYTT
jgi:hypothetical protein